MGVMTERIGTLNPIRVIKDDRDFFKPLLALAVPIALQNLVYTALNMLDTFMIGQLGEAAIGAVALSNQIYFLQMITLFGISSGSSVFTAQFWGKKDEAGLQKTTGLALLLGLISAGVFTALTQLFPREILGLFSRDETVIALVVPYLRITSAGYMFTAVSIILSGVLRSTGVVKMPLYISVGAISLNALFNYLLIFGKMGFPRLGATGAALATTLARVLEMVVLLILLYGRKYPGAFHPRKMGPFTKKYLGRYFHRLYPVLLNEIGWAGGMTLYTLVYARMGTDILAGFNITNTIVQFAFVFFIGTGNASAVILGNMIGRDAPREDLQRCSRKILYISPLLGFFFVILIVILAPYVPLLFKITPEVRRLVTHFMYIVCPVILIKVSNIHIIVGILRSGGDTHMCAALELIPLWLIAIPVMAYTGLVLGWNPLLVYLLSMSEEFFKYFLGLARVLSGKWIHNVT
ncbi:MAG: MATE family efflux transporter [Spirochaetales bacterium]|nr:MATE family efflux transporter [Spirochaetales bacterium]